MPARMTHLLPDDRLLFQQYLDKHGQQYNYIDYDVRVGTGRPAPDHFEDNIKKMAIQLSQRRIDAVCHLDNEIHIVEVTLSAGIKALGQLVVYPELYKQTFEVNLPIKRILVTRSVMPDMTDQFTRIGVSIFIFPDPTD